MSSLLIIGHRGAPDSGPENTRSSLRAALDAGADILEIDVRLTSDGHIVLSHDADFSGLGGPAKPIRDCTRKELSGFKLSGGVNGWEQPLFMDEALVEFPAAEFNVDLKDSGSRIVYAWVKLLDESGAGTRCRTASFHDRTLSLFRRLRPDLTVSVARFGVAVVLLTTLLGRPRKPRRTEGVLQIPERAGCLRVVTPRRIRKWQARGWKTQVWTVDNKDDMHRLIEWGVDGLITNRPSLLKQVLISRKQRSRLETS